MIHKMNDAILIQNIDPQYINDTHSHRHRHHQADTHISSNNIRDQNPTAEIHADLASTTNLQQHQQISATPSTHEYDVFSRTSDKHESQFHEVFPSSGTTATTNYNLTMGQNKRMVTFNSDGPSSNIRNNSVVGNDDSLAFYSHFDPNTPSEYGNASEFLQNEFVPFNTDEDSSAPHFDAEFFREPMLTFSSDAPSNNIRNNSVVGNDDSLPFYSRIDSNIPSDYDNASEFLQNEFIPFNTDEDSPRPHFDKEFFNGDETPFYSQLNSTTSILPDMPLDRFSFTPWEASPESTADVNQLHFFNSSQPFNHYPLFDKSNTTLLFNQNSILADYNFSISALNFAASAEGDFNSSTSGSSGSSQYDTYIWSILIMAPLVIFGITGNTLVILAISLEKRLQNVTNYFLLSLAVTDLLVSLIVMPFSIINVLTGRWLFGLLLCDFFVTSDVLMCTSSILHLCTISLERYIGIRYPLWTKNKSKRIVLLKIVLVWTISLAISSPITILGVVKEDNVLSEGSCVLNNEYFIIYGSITAFYIPLAIMVLMYALTTRLLNKQARLCNSQPAEDGEGQPMIRRSTSRRNWQARRKFYSREAPASYNGAQLIEGGIAGVMAPFHQRYRTVGVNRHNTVPVSYHHVPHRHHNDVSGGGGGGSSSAVSNSSINCMQKSGSYKSAAVVNNNNNSNNCMTDNNISASHSGEGGRCNRYALHNGTDSTVYKGLKQVSDFSNFNGRQGEITADPNSDPQNCCTSRVYSSSSSPSPTSTSNREGRRLRDLVRKHHVAVKAANILLMKRDNAGQGQASVPASSNSASVRRDNSVRTEQKASKVLGVVFMIFVICWAPFFTVNILTALCTSCKFESTLITAFVWLGYVSSTLNPIIYTIFNNIFRITFIKLICCRYHLLHRANKRNAALPGIRNGLLTCSTFCPAPFVSSTTPNTSTFEESHC